ncbi:hypothetical protein N790_04940 [Arenimonas malthae CC-JY-1]|uniref:Peptidase S1 domain-containing protein n=1 Tax=Arenimonas malthae CC-JY-1 TaxID=1384054 RepID=A0A091BJ51_9GAMM|nr:trypsin-like peptidase domain-containing protein [Arenimonas malthae]KFN50809.1 hypothetical protein N790_04940 [Arenimonas malthae CC-JY-1]
MNARTALSAALLLALGLGAGGAFAASPPTAMGGEPAIATKAEPVVTWAMAEFPQGMAATHVMEGLDPKRILEVQAHNARGGNVPTQIGVNRAVQSPLQALKWVAAPGGSVARVEITSPDALGMRVGLDLSGLPAGVELRFAGDLLPDRITRVPVEQAKSQLANGVYWSPMTDGATQVIEVFAPAGTPTAGLKLAAPQVSHLLTNTIEQFSLAKAIGDSGACNVDTKCREAALGQNFINAKNAVARMVYTDSGTFTCTGTLLNDTDNTTQVPYFWTANHCIDNQTVASTLITYWGFEATVCGGSTPAANTARSGGAAYLYSEANTDAALLRLNDTPPAGAYYAGWDANQVPANANVLAIHHPAGDLKKSSLGNQVSQDSYNIAVGWTSGTTEGGSSGSGLFTLGNGYQLRGGLYGGSASCANSGSLANTSNRDYYSRLDVVWPQVQPYLAPTPQSFGPTPGRDYTGAWYNPNESGWGLTVYQYAGPAYNTFVMFFIYDQTGKAQWFEMDATWTATDVRSGNLLQSTAAPWGPTYNPANRQFTVAGNATLTFTSATTANVTFTVNGATRTIALQKL